MNILSLIGRNSPLFEEDLAQLNETLKAEIHKARFLVIGGAGSIGQAVAREIFKRRPAALHVVDISENNMVELVRDIRSTLGYIDGDFRDIRRRCGSRELRSPRRCRRSGYDYVLNLSALKHVRSEKDPFTLMRMVDVNIFNTAEDAGDGRGGGAKKYFCVSTDKAANPVNMMGASKRIMEMFLMRESLTQPSLHGAVRECRLFRWLAASWLEPAVCQEATRVRPQRRSPLFRDPAGIGRIMSSIMFDGQQQ